MYYLITPANQQLNTPIPGKGFQSGTAQVTLNDGVVSPDINIDDTKKSRIHISYTKEFSQVNFEITSTLSVSTAASIANLASIEASITSKFKNDKTNFNGYAVVIVEQLSRSKIVSNPKFSKIAKEHLSKNETASFYQQLGNEYVSKVDYGQIIIAVLKLNTSKKETSTNLNTNAKFNLQVASGAAGAGFLLDKLNSSDIVQCQVITFGSSASALITNFDELTKLIKVNLDGSSNTPIGYATSQYTTVEDFSEEFRNNIQTIENIASEINEVNKLIKTSKRKLLNLCDEDNIIYKNTYFNRKNDKKYQLVMDSHLKQKLAKLEQLEYQILGKNYLPTDADFIKIKKEVEDISDWYSLHKKEIKEAVNLALIEKIKFNGTKRAAPLALNIPEAIKKSSKCFFLQFETTDNTKLNEFEYYINQIGFFAITPVCQRIPAKGCYIQGEIAQLNSLKILLPKNMPHAPIVLNVYVTDKVPKDADFTDINESIGKGFKAHPDGAAAYPTSSVEPVEMIPFEAETTFNFDNYEQYEFVVMDQTPAKELSAYGIGEVTRFTIHKADSKNHERLENGNEEQEQDVVLTVNSAATNQQSPKQHR